MRRKFRIGLIALAIGGTAVVLIWQETHKTEYEKLVERAARGEISGDPSDDPGFAITQRRIANEEGIVPRSEGWERLNRIILETTTEFPPSTIRRADEGDPTASLEYGYHIVAKAAVNDTEPLAAIPYLMTAALAGDIGAHVQLGLIEAVSRQDGDLVKAWAHFDIALREMPQTARDYRRSQMHFDEIDTGLSETERARAKALSADYSETMRTNRNALK